jgi:hypothetical protein
MPDALAHATSDPRPSMPPRSLRILVKDCIIAPLKQDSSFGQHEPAIRKTNHECLFASAFANWQKMLSLVGGDDIYIHTPLSLEKRVSGYISI